MPSKKAPVLKTKSDIIAALADKAGITKAQAKTAIEAIPAMVLAGAKDGFTFPGLGKFYVLTPKAKERTMKVMLGKDKGKTIKVKTSKALKFKPAKVAKDAVNKK